MAEQVGSLVFRRDVGSRESPSDNPQMATEPEKPSRGAVVRMKTRRDEQSGRPFCK